MTRFAALITTRLPAWPDKLIDAGGNLPGRLFASRTTSPIFDLSMMFFLGRLVESPLRARHRLDVAALANRAVALVSACLVFGIARGVAVTDCVTIIRFKGILLTHNELHFRGGESRFHAHHYIPSMGVIKRFLLPYPRFLE